MTNIYIDRDNYEIRIEGHSNGKRNTKGNDLVCCAVSTLTCALANGFMEYEQKGMLADKPQLCVGVAKSRLCAKPKESYVKEVSAGYGLIVRAFEALANTYPDNIKIIK